ncbi:50S ribosomal protein L11 methyltransferase [Cobetia sp.]|uniref:50S ribosomal protein L11 methyltransferase n=1 Tax=Cobetia sp. TaxID=1873876 RepID=UPI000E7E53E2|nr:50S ribosomal protein L11 methyltransferase [Cobetia sp.]HBJ27814.1 50S ribosomal protein L11 methyltransferase [Cobetia sp.]
MSWLQLKARIAPDHAEILEHLLMEEGACAITLQDAEDQPLFEPDLGSTPLWSETVLTGLWDGTEGIEAMRERVKAGWAALIPDEPCPEIEVEILEDRDWAREWMDGFEPLKMGQRLWIVPSWHDAPEQDAVNLMLDPGLAFGTGTHPTTALCLEWLDGQQLEGCSVIDFGCGSGILAIAALLLGAPQAVGTDIDPQALEASRDNASRNGIDPARFPVYLPADMPQQQADVVVANILAGPLVALAAQITTLVRGGGRLALSGILAEQAEEVRAAYAEAFDLDPTAVKDGWVRISGVKR